MNRRRKRGWIWLIVLAAVAAAVVFGFRYLDQKTAEANELALAAMERSYTVARGDIETVIVADGTLAAHETVSIRVPDGLKVDKVLVKAGEEVQAGQVIATLDAASVRAQMLNMQKKLKQEDGSYNTPGSYKSLVAPTKCRLKYMPVSEGDDVRTAMDAFGALAIVSADGWMRLAIQTEETLTLGSRLSVKWDGGGVDGTVSQKTDDGYVLLVPDERAPYMAEAKVYRDGKEIGGGTLYINMPIAVLGYSGTINKIKYKVNESVPDGREIFELKNASPSIAFELHYISRDSYARQMVKLIAYSSDPRILAERDGVIAELSIKDGEPTGKTTGAENESVGYTLDVGGAVKMNINVDELDILKVTEGATAEVSLEALQSETLTGKVTAISKIGKKNNSISVFPVELTLAPDERLLSGMNGSATILIDRAENVLLIPVEAIGEDELGPFVNKVREDGTSARVPIATGRSDGKVAEVTEGLAEGDVIKYRVVGDLFGMMGMGAVSVSSTDEDGNVTVTDVG